MRKILLSFLVSFSLNSFLFFTSSEDLPLAQEVQEDKAQGNVDSDPYLGKVLLEAIIFLLLFKYSNTPAT